MATRRDDNTEPDPFASQLANGKAWCGATDERPFPSLGWSLWELCDELWPEEPLIVEQAEIITEWYRLDEQGRRLHRRGQLMGPKGCFKSPFAARLAILELVADVRFAGWDANGHPVGRPWDNPVVQIAAVSESQAMNCYSALLDLLGRNDGRVADEFELDAGQTRVLRRGQPGSRIEAVTASAGTREGARLSFAVLDESMLWTRQSHGHRLADTLRRNAAKVNGSTLETTNAYDPNLETVAQATDEAVVNDAAGIYQWKPTVAHVASMANHRELRAALVKVYGGAWWVDVDRLVEDIHDPGTAEDDARRFFLNEVVKTADVAWSPEEWEPLARPAEVVGRGEAIALAFDGSLVDDATALVGCRLSDGHLFLLDCWESDGSADWRVDSVAVDAAVRAAFAYFDVVRFYADPPHYQDQIAQWSADLPGVREWWTNRDRAMAWAVRRFTEGVAAGTVTFDGSTVLRRHVLNARKKLTNLRDGEGRFMWTVRKSAAKSPLKIDACVAAIIALEARADALTAGWRKAEMFVPRRIR